MATRKEQKDKRREDIILAGIDLFIKNGYAGTKINDIAKKLNISDGLLFHYFESKEDLYLEVVKMGLKGIQFPFEMDSINDPTMFFEGFATQLFAYAKENNWVAKMFTLMGQAQRSESTPQAVKEIAMQVNTIEMSVDIIKVGQNMGVFKQGDPLALSNTYWWFIQSVMENYAVNPEMTLPEVSWLMDMIKVR